MQANRTGSTTTGEHTQDTTGEHAGCAATERNDIDTVIAERVSSRRVEQEQIEEAIMGLLLGGEHEGPWMRPEIEREIGGNLLNVCDALIALHGSGLIHLEGELVIASRAARRMDELGV